MIYAGRHGMPLGLQNCFALELNVFNPQVASSWVQTVKDDNHSWHVMYHDGKKEGFLTYPKYPNFYRYHSDSYSPLKKFYDKNSRTDFYGFYNIVSTQQLVFAQVEVNDISPMHVEAEYYEVPNPREVDVTLGEKNYQDHNWRQRRP